MNDAEYYGRRMDSEIAARRELEATVKRLRAECAEMENEVGLAGDRVTELAMDFRKVANWLIKARPVFEVAMPTLWEEIKDDPVWVRALWRQNQGRWVRTDD